MSEKVLVVDDEIMVLDTYGAFLSMSGYVPILALSVAEARSCLEKNDDIKLVVTDLKMPEESGLALVDYLNRNYPHLPVVVITGNPDGGSSFCAYENGVIDFLVKPVRKANFMMVVDNVLRNQEKPSVINGEDVDDLLAGLEE